MSAPRWHAVTLATLVRAECMGFRFGADPRRHGGLALVTRRGQVLEFRSKPMAVRLYSERRFHDA
jgi:hypothetical protein